MRKKIFALVLIFALAVVTLSGCVINTGRGAVTGRGRMETHTIQVEGFTGLNISGGYEITFRQSPNYSVTLEIQGNLFEHVEANVRGGVLHIGSSRGFNTGVRNTPRLYVYAPSLESLTVAGAVSGDIDVNTESLNIDVSGAANLTLYGSADMLNISASGAANVNGFEMTATNAVINVAGAGNIDVYASNTLNVTLSGVGRVRYDGNPQVTRNVSGLGSVSSR